MNANAAQPADDSQSCSGCLRACVRGIPAVTRLLIVSTLVLWLICMVVPYIAVYTMVHPPSIFGGYAFLLYTPFVSIFFESNGWVGGLLCALFLYQAAQKLEGQRGSIWFLHAFYTCGLLANILFIIIDIFLVYGFQWDFSRSFASAGPLPAIFAIMAINAKLSTEENTPCCGSCTVPTRLYPWIMVTIFGLFGSRIDVVCGLLVGYLFLWQPRLQLDIATCKRIEGSSKMSWLTSRHLFLSTESAGSFQMFNPMQPRGPDGDSEAPASQSIPTVDSRAVFQSGGGHRLGSRQDSRPAAYTAGAGPSQPPQSAASAAAVEAARLKRLAAAERRLGATEMNAIVVEPNNQSSINRTTGAGSSSSVSTATISAPAPSAPSYVSSYDDLDDDEDARLLAPSAHRSQSSSFSPEFSSSLLHGIEVPEHLILRLTALGHSRERAIAALQAANNDWVQAAKSLKGEK